MTITGRAIGPEIGIGHDSHKLHRQPGLGLGSPPPSAARASSSPTPKGSPGFTPDTRVRPSVGGKAPIPNQSIGMPAGCSMTETCPKQNQCWLI